MSMEPFRNSTLFLHHSGSIYHITIDLLGRFTYVNQLYEKIFFSSEENVSDQSFEDSIVKEDLPAYKQVVQECIQNPGRTVCIDLRRSRRDGSSFWIRWEFCAIVENEQVTGIQALGTDASERKRAETER